MRLARLAALVAALAVTTSVYAADATYPSDDTICPLLHEHIECRANGDCGPYNYTGRDGFWDLYDAAKPSTLSNATQTCYGLTNATSCDGNSLCHWIYGWCALKHTEVYDLISADGAPASWTALMSLYWNECWFLDATECEYAARCAMQDFDDYYDEGENYTQANYTQCALIKDIEVAIAAVGCRKTQSFADVAQTWGVNLDATISLQITASTSCGSVSAPANGKYVDCHIMLDGDRCEPMCDASYVREWGNSTAKCEFGVFTPATCRKPYAWGDDEFCPAWEQQTTCHALGKCDDFSYEFTYGYLNETFSDYDEYTGEYTNEYHRVLEYCYQHYDDEESCVAKPECVFFEDYGDCVASSDAVANALENDGAPQSHISYFEAAGYHDCWYINDDLDCLADSRCQQGYEEDYDSTYCRPSNETEFRLATAACGAHASFDAAQAAYGLSYPGKIGCQRVCEGWNVTRSACEAKTQCEWFVDRCVSSGNGACSGDAPDAASAPTAPPTQADVDAKKEVAETLRADADSKRENAESTCDDLLTSIGDARDRRLAEIFANAALAGASAIAKIGGLQLAAADEDAACDDAFAKMRLEATKGACDVATFAAGRKRALLSARNLLATYDVSVYLDPARVNATEIDALVLTLSSAGLAPTTATSDPISELASIPGIDSGLLATFKTEATVAVAAEAAAVEAEASAEAAEQSLSDAGRVDGSGDAANEAGDAANDAGDAASGSGLDATADAVPPPPPKLLVGDYESSARRTASAALAVLAAFVCAAA